MFKIERSDFKSFKLKKVMAYFLIFFGLIVFVFFAFLKFHPIFGGKSDSESLIKIQNSVNFKDGHFQNLEPTTVMVESQEPQQEKFSFWKMLRPPKDKNPQRPLPSIKFSEEQVQDESFTWFGHSSLLIKTTGKTVLIDPVFNRASPIPLFGKPFQIEHPIELSDLPPIDVVMISHNHYDHLDYRTIKELGNKVDKYLVPLGIKAYLTHWGIEADKIEELDWFQATNYDKIKFVFAPARHFSGRSLTDRSRTLWGSWIIQTSEQKIYFSGDSGYSEQFQKIGKQYGPFDISFIENGAYNQAWRQIHLMPEEGVQAGLDLQSKVVFPIHWAKFDLSSHPWDEPIERFVAEAKVKNLTVVTALIGETFQLKKIPQKHWWEDLRK